LQQTRNRYSNPDKPASKITVISDDDKRRFLEFSSTDLDLSRSTAMSYFYSVRKFLNVARRFDIPSMRAYLAQVENPYTFNDYLKAFLAFSRFLGLPEPAFRFKRVDAPIIVAPKDSEVREFYSALDVDYERLAYLGYAATGLRRRELLDLPLAQINTEMRMITPQHRGKTKRSFITFYNAEFEGLLSEWLKRPRVRHSDRLFPISGSAKSCIFMIAHKKTGLYITPQSLRVWFVKKMGEAQVPDRFIDAFTGHIPRSVLARHYTDYSMETLKAIYDKAGLMALH